MAKRRKAHARSKACPVSKVKASFKMGARVYEVCARGKRPVVTLLTEAALAHRTKGQLLAAAKKAKQEQRAAHEAVMKKFDPGSSFEGYRRRKKRY